MQIQVVFRGVIVADSRRGSAGPGSVVEVPFEDVRMDYLIASNRPGYFDLVLMEWRVAEAAWVPSQGAVAFDPKKVDRCLVDGEPMQVQPD